MPKSQPLWKADDAFLCGSSGWHPPRMTDIVLSLSIVHCFCIFVILIKLFVLKLQGWFDILLCHLIQTCRPIKKICTLTCDHEQSWITITINHPHRISISLITVCYEPFENYLWNIILCHYDIQIFQNRVCVVPSLDCRSQHAIVNTLQYRLSYTWQAIAVQSFTHLTCPDHVYGLS